MVDPKFWQYFVYGFCVGLYIIWIGYLLGYMGNCSRRAAAPGPFPVRSTAEQSTRARDRWQKAAKRIRWLLRVRRLWAHLGHYLNRPEVLTLTAGFDRRGGVLVRTAPAPNLLNDRLRARLRARAPRRQ